MFWKKKNEIPEPLHFELNKEGKRGRFPFPERHCWLYISYKYTEILFVPMGKIDSWKSCELDSVVVKEWPMNIGELQHSIQETLDKWKDSVTDVNPSNDNWHSFKASKAKTQKSFQVDYVQVSLTTDMEREYAQDEVERILVKASPKNWQNDSYKLVGKNHLLETQVAQVVMDIFNACEKIRMN
jgi:hypothetical protein